VWQGELEVLCNDLLDVWTSDIGVLDFGDLELDLCLWF
jgi:hypothetical protein